MHLCLLEPNTFIQLTSHNAIYYSIYQRIKIRHLALPNSTIIQHASNDIHCVLNLTSTNPCLNIYTLNLQSYAFITLQKHVDISRNNIYDSYTLHQHISSMQNNHYIYRLYYHLTHEHISSMQ